MNLEVYAGHWRIKIHVDDSGSFIQAPWKCPFEILDETVFMAAQVLAIALGFAEIPK